MKKENNTKYAILGLLSLMAMTGYDIKKYLAQSTITFWQATSGQVYPTLKVLLDQELIICKEKCPINSKRKKIIYNITDKGKQVLINWLNEPTNYQNERNIFKLKFIFGKNISLKDTAKQIQHQKKISTDKLNEYLETKRHIELEHPDYFDSAVYILMILKNNIYHEKAEIKWCNEVLKSFEKGNSNE